MNLHIELEKAEREVKDLECRQASFRDGVLSVDKEITLLSIKELSLRENLKNLRKESIIVLAVEFRRIQEDLTRTTVRLAMIRKDKISLENSLVKVIEFLSRAKLKLAELKELEGTNVISGNFWPKIDK